VQEGELNGEDPLRTYDGQTFVHAGSNENSTSVDRVGKKSPSRINCFFLPTMGEYS